MFEEYPDIMTALQVAEALRIGRSSAYNLINSKSLAHIRIGALIRVPKKCLIDHYEKPKACNANLMLYVMTKIT